MIGGGFFVSVPLHESEAVVWRCGANRKQGWTTRGGRLHVTTERLVFTPHRFDAILGAAAVAIALDEIASVSKLPRDATELWAGGSRKRLCLTLRGGDQEIFVVRHPDEAAEKIRGAAGVAS